MRAREIPRILFRKILKCAHISKPLQMHYPDHVLKVAFLTKSDAVVGWMEYRREEGIFSRLNIWEFSFDPSFCPEDFFQSNVFHEYGPTLSIMGGPLKDQQSSDPVLGHQFIEEILVEFGGRSDDGLRFLLDSPLLGLIAAVIRDARSLQRRTNPAKHAYWQRGLGPKKNYLD